MRQTSHLFSMILKHPFTCIISGPTGCGKTSLVKSIFLEDAVQPRPKHILWLYAADQPLYKGMKQVNFVKGIPENIESRFNPSHNNLLIIDDLMTELHSDARLTRLFSVGSHHRNLSVIFIVHNLFHQGREMRNISLNSHYLILFKNPRDKQQVATLARQMYPSSWRFLVEAYNDATANPHGYLLLDLKPSTDGKFRVRSKILPGEVDVVYIEKSDEK